MHVLVISATIALASASQLLAAGALRDYDLIVIADETPSRGILDAPELFLPIEAAEAYEPLLLSFDEPWPRATKSITANRIRKGIVRLHNKHDYG